MIIKPTDYKIAIGGAEYPPISKMDSIYPTCVSGYIQVEETWEQWEFLACVVYDVPYTKIRAIPPGLFPFF